MRFYFFGVQDKLPSKGSQNIGQFMQSGASAGAVCNRSLITRSCALSPERRHDLVRHTVLLARCVHTFGTLLKYNSWNKPQLNSQVLLVNKTFKAFEILEAFDKLTKKFQFDSKQRKAQLSFVFHQIKTSLYFSE